MKIRVTFDLGERERCAIAHQTRHPAPGIDRGPAASRSDAQAWIEKTVYSTLEVLVAELDEHEREEHMKRLRARVEAEAIEYSKG